MNYNELGTEKANDLSRNLDSMSALDIVSLMNRTDEGALTAVRKALPQIAQTAEEAAKRISLGGRVFYMGAGTSGRLGVLDASECPPTFGVSPDVFVGIIAGGDTALRTAVEGAEDSETLGAADLEAHNVNENDIVIAISASGTAPYCISALKKAGEAGAKRVCMCCNTGSALSKYADIAIEMPTGPEILAGSTRLRAGTATKLALNMISTAAMVRLGKVYKNLMVDVRATNTKLKDRAVRITMQATNTDRQTAEKLLESAAGSIKCAIIMHKTGAAYEEAEKALKQAGGFVAGAIDML